MNKIRLIILLQLVAFFSFSQNNDAINADSVLSAYKQAIDTAHGDSIPVNWMQSILQTSISEIKQLSDQKTISDSIIKQQKRLLKHQPKQASTAHFPKDTIHLALYAAITVLFILLLVFLFLYIKTRKKYNEVLEEYDEIEEALEEFIPGDKEVIEKINSLSETFNELNQKTKVFQNELADSNEKLSFIKVENEKLLEQLDHAQKEDKPSDNPETVEKILDLEKSLENLKKENEELRINLKEQRNTAAKEPENKITAYLNLSAEAKKQLEEIDFNLAKLERVSKMYEAKMITKDEYKELKGRIFEKI